MDIKKSIEELAEKRGRVKAKAEAIYSTNSGAVDAAVAMDQAKNAKDFDKFKSQCLATIEAGEKAIKAWQVEMDAWNAAIASLESEVAAEKAKIEQQQKEVDAVNKSIDDINAEIQAYNDDLLLGEHDPRYRPLVLKKSSGDKLASVTASLNEAAALAKREREALTQHKGHLGEGNILSSRKGEISKAKFKAAK
jgi:chromosome segregation ATPase